MRARMWALANPRDEGAGSSPLASSGDVQRGGRGLACGQSHLSPDALRGAPRPSGRVDRRVREAVHMQQRGVPSRRYGSDAELVVDLSRAVAGLALLTAGGVGRRAQGLAGAAADTVLEARMLPRGIRPATVLGRIGRRGAAYRAEALERLSRVLDAIVPVLVSEVVRRIELTELVEDHVDLNRVLLKVDLDAAARRLDVDALASRVDMTAVLGRLDLTEIVRRQLDLDRLVAVVDLDAAASRLDVDAVVQRIDLVSLAREVIAEIDLPEIIRESTGAMASESLLGVRMQSISGDDAVGRGIERLRLRWGRRGAEDTAELATGPEEPVPGPPEPDPPPRVT